MGRGWLKTHRMKTPRTTHRSDASCNVASPWEFEFSRTPVPFTPWLSSLKDSRTAAAWNGLEPAGTTRREEPGAERAPCIAHAHPRPPRMRQLTWKTEASLNSLEMQKYLFWFPSLFLEILFWFIKHRKSRHLKQTFKTPMWQITDFLGN